MRFRIILWLALLLTAASTVLAQPKKSISRLNFAAITRIGQSASASGEVGNEVRTGPEVDVFFTKPQVSGTISPARVASAHVPRPAGSAVGGTGSDNFFGFNGLTHLDQRLASGGNQPGQKRWRRCTFNDLGGAQRPLWRSFGDKRFQKRFQVWSRRTVQFCRVGTDPRSVHIALRSAPSI